MTGPILFLAYRGKGIISKLIKWQTRGPYSHIAIYQDGTLWEAHMKKGVIRRETTLADEYRDGASAFKFEQEPLDGVKAEMIMFWNAQVGKPYDLTMVARFISRRQETRKSRGKWFCSELAFAPTVKAGVALFKETEPWEVSPNLFVRSPVLTRCS